MDEYSDLYGDYFEDSNPSFQLFNDSTELEGKEEVLPKFNPSLNGTVEHELNFVIEEPYNYKPYVKNSEKQKNKQKKETRFIDLTPDNKLKKPRSMEQKRTMKRSSTQKTIPYNLNYDIKEFTSNSQNHQVVNQVGTATVSYNRGPWSPDEINRFEEGYKTLGHRWKKISVHFVKTRNVIQVSCFGQKYVSRIEH
eukprot:gene3023-5033_t